MSAAEKLKALEARGRVALKEPVSQSSRWDEEIVLADLVDALPQIVAVVEAAENYREEFALRGVQTAESGQAWRDLQSALAALDEVLTADGKTPK